MFTIRAVKLLKCLIWVLTGIPRLIHINAHFNCDRSALVNLQAVQSSEENSSHDTFLKEIIHAN